MTANTTTRRLLACGVVGAPLFLAAVLIQEYSRDGFDPKRHALSQLSTGDLGWVQITNFIVAGVLFLAAAVGIRRALHPGRAGTWGPWLYGIFGASLIWGGVFVADPANGFPPGTPDGSPAELSWHGILHTLAPAMAAIAMTVACFVFARRFAGLGQRGWAGYSVATAVVSLVLSLVSFPAGDFRVLLLGGAVLWLWSSAVAAKLLAESR